MEKTATTSPKEQPRVASSSGRLSGWDKAAILLMSMGIENTKEITKHLNQKQVIDLIRYISEIGEVADEKVQSVLNEFRERASNAGYGLPNVSGKEFATDMLKQTMQVEHFMALEFLQDADVNQILEIIRHEHPQVIALVMSYLPSEAAGQLLASLPEQDQIDIAFRIINMEAPQRLGLKHLDQMLNKKLEHLTTGSKKVGGLEILVKIFRGTGRATEKMILEAIHERDPEKAEEIERMMFTFEDLLKLNDRNIQRIIKEMDNKVLAMAFKKTLPEIKELFMRNMSERARAMLEEEITALGPVFLRDVEKAQREINELVRGLLDKGEIRMAEAEDEIVT